MTNLIVQLLKDRNKFALLEAGLLTASFIFFNLEEGYWVFTSFFAILAALFYIGVNYDRIFGKVSNVNKIQNNPTALNNGFLDQSLFYELEKISESAQNSIKTVDEIKNELSNMTAVLEQAKL